jgi:hypothetical protein
VYEGGGVGVFGEVGVADACVREGRWTRVVVTLGTPQAQEGPSAATLAALTRGQQRNRVAPGRGSGGGAGAQPSGGAMSPGEDEEDDAYMSDGDEASPRYSRPAVSSGLRMGRGLGGGPLGGGAAPSVKCMTTYVDSRKCSCVSAASRGVIGVRDGRFALSTQGFNLFASSQMNYMPGLLVRLVELRPAALSEARVKEAAFSNRIYSAWDREKTKYLAEMRANMTLQPLYKAPPPIYAHPVFVAEVGDAFLEGTGLDGGSLPSAAAALSLTVERLVRSAAAPLGFLLPACEEAPEAKHLSSLTFDRLGFSHADLQAINFLTEALKQAKNLFQRFGMAQKNGPAQLIHFMKHFKARLAALSEGGVLLVPGGIEAASYVYVIERQDAARYRFSIFNADAEGGLSFHASTAAVPNKLKYQNMLSVNDVSADRIMDDAFWGMLFKLAVFPDAKFNTPAKLYAWLLPFLADRSTDHVLSESAVAHGENFRTPPRSDTGFLRCLTDASAYILRSRGVSNDACSLFLFLLRVQLVEFALHDTQFVPYLRGSDRAVLRIAASQLAYAAVKLGGGAAAPRASALQKLAEETPAPGAMDVVSVEGEDAAAAAGSVAGPGPGQGGEGLLSSAALDDVQAMVEALLVRCDAGRLEDKTEVSLANPRPMHLTRPAADVANPPMAALLHPFADRLVRLEDVNGLAGAPLPQPKYVPVDFLQLPVRVGSLEDAVKAIRLTDRLCTLLSVQTKAVKNTNLLKVSAIQNTFTRLVPVPKAPEASDYDKCIWRTPMRYGLQLDLVICLGKLFKLFECSSYICFNRMYIDLLY